MAAPSLTSQQCCTPCDGVQTVQVPGTPGATGAAGADGDDGVNAYTTTTAAFVMPALGGTVVVMVGNSDWMSVGQIVYVETAGWMEVSAVTSTNQVSLDNIETVGGAYSDNVAPATNILAGSKVSPGGLQGQGGATAYTASGDIELDGATAPRLAITTTKGDLIVNLNGATAPRNTRQGVGANHQMLHCDATDATGISWRSLDLTGVSSSLTGQLPVASGGTGAANAAGARTNLVAAASGANADITSLTALSTPLSVVQGGTGVAALQSFSASSSGAQSITSGSATKIRYDSENWDAAGVFDSGATWRYTPTVAGKYHLDASIELSSVAAAKRVEIHIYKNNAVFVCSARFWNGSGAAADVQASISVDVTANGTDYFDARVYHDHGSSRNTSTDTTRNFFNGHWCG